MSNISKLVIPAVAAASIFAAAANADAHTSGGGGGGGYGWRPGPQRPGPTFPTNPNSGDQLLRQLLKALLNNQ